jgi:Concanavalin A-like lectin/glucanases superfamily/Carbohydrate-binding module 64
LTNFTIATWVKLDTTNSWRRLFDFGTGTTTNMFLVPQSGSGAVRFAITTSGGGGEQQINGSSALSTGSWQHVAVTLNGSAGTLYVNGVQVGQNTSMSLNPASLGSTSNNYIGRSQYSDEYLDGQVDDFRIYNRALSASEVQTLYGGTTLTPTPTATIGKTNTPTPTATIGKTNTPTPTATIGKTNTPTPTANTPTRTLTPSITPTANSVCSPVTSTITAPFTYDGAGTFCWQSSNLGSYINSWNTTSVSVNGTNYTNLYVAAGSLPAKVNGYWYVSYNSTVSWAHFEAK